jgi:hypothetical protein
MEVTVVSLARSVLDTVVTSARSTLADEVARLLGVPKEVEFIRSELEMMQSALKDASAAHPEAAGRNETVRTMVKQLREHAYDFEDCLLDFTLFRDRTSSSRAGSWQPSAVAERHRLAARIRDLKASVEALNLRSQRYRIFADLTAPRGAEENSAAAMLVADDHGDVHSSADGETAFKESDIIGRRHDKTKLTSWLIISPAEPAETIHDEDQQALAVAPTYHNPLRGLMNLVYSYIIPTWRSPSIGAAATRTPLPLQVSLPPSPGAGAVGVVAVCGMGGMGKSSLVRMVHNDPDVIAEFDCAAWITVPHPLDNPDVFRKRLGKELGLAPGKKIGEFLRKRRYLVVVDDLESREEWNTVWQVFQFHNDKDSRIIVTTRREDVARHCTAAGQGPDGQDLLYELKPLDKEASKSLLCQKVRLLHQISLCFLPRFSINIEKMNLNCKLHLSIRKFIMTCKLQQRE